MENHCSLSHTTKLVGLHAFPQIIDDHRDHLVRKPQQSPPLRVPVTHHRLKQPPAG